MREFRIGYWSTHILIVIAIVITLIYASLIFSGEIEISIQPALFSTLVQTSCTIFALIFTISLVAAQIGSKYSQETMDLIFNKYTIFYMFLYLLAIVYGICGLLNKCIDISMTRIWVALTVMNFSLLIPFIHSVKEKLKTKNLLRILSQRAIKAKKKNKPFAKYINAIDNIIYSSYKDMDFIAFEEGIRGLLFIYVKASDPEYLEETIMKTIKYVDSLSFKEERSTDIIMDALQDAALKCLDDVQKVDSITIELANLTKPVDDVRLKARYVSRSWEKAERIFRSCTENGAKPEVMHQMYYRIFSMAGFYLLTLHEIVRDAPVLRSQELDGLLVRFVKPEVIKIVEPGSESILNDLIPLIGDLMKEAEKRRFPELRNYYVDALIEIKEKADKKDLIFQSKRISDICDEIFGEGISFRAS